MSLYVTRASLEVNGAVISDFKAVTMKSRAIRKQIPLMYSTGHGQITQRYQIDLDYVVPQTNPYNFDAVAGGTLNIEYDSGERVEFGGVYTLDVGDANVDGEKEVIQKITLGAETRNGNFGDTTNE